MSAARRLIALASRSSLCALALLTVRPTAAPATEPLLDAFLAAAADLPAADRGTTTISRDYALSGSVWAEGLDETQVFLAELAHRQGNDDSFTLRVGKGGQSYSLRGAFGESVPPSRRDAGNHRSPWNDEVWQFVAVCTRYNGVTALMNAGAVPDAVQERFNALPFESSFFIHNSGAYIPDRSAVQSLYCPLLAFEADAEARTIRTLTWGLVPQVRTIHRSPVLYYTQVRDAGEGIVELTWLVHNFSLHDDIVFDHLNAPWGGTRHTSLPVHAIAAPDGQPRPRDEFFPAERPDQEIDLALSLAGRVDYGLLTFDPTTTPRVPVHVADGRVVHPAAAEGPPAFEVYAKPVTGSLPLFLLENTATGREVVSTDPYRFVPQESLDLDVPADHPYHGYYSQVKGIALDRHTTRRKRLLGYAPRSCPAEEGFVPLSTAVGPDLFPVADAHHVDVWVLAHTAPIATPPAVTPEIAPPPAAADVDAARRQILALGDLKAAPAMQPADGYPAADGLRAIYFDALPWKGRPTKVFAWLGLPAHATGKMPGVVLVHGGGGSAFKEWVTRWNEHGFVAISISVEGQTDAGDPELPKGKPGYRRHAWAGPQRDGIYGDSAEPLADQWIYHAVADTVLANSLLRSLPEVDAGKVGVMGISWGGVITSTVIGIDDRFAFAIPMYGCGMMHASANQYGRALGTNQLYREAWDPLVRMDRATMPVLWFSWPQDAHFPLDCQAACYRAAPGPHMVSLVPGMGHGHDFRAPQGYAFAEGIVRDGRPWCVQAAAAVAGDAVSVEFASTQPLDRATLVTTADGGFTGDRTWNVSPADLEHRGDRWIVAASLPAGTTAWFVNVHRGDLVASSDFQERR